MTKPEKLINLLEKIKEAIETGRYRVTFHAFERQNERKVNLATTLYVLKNGYEEKRKTTFDYNENTWKYAIRGKTKQEEFDVRVIVAFDDNQMLIITVIRVENYE